MSLTTDLSGGLFGPDHEEPKAFKAAGYNPNKRLGMPGAMRGNDMFGNPRGATQTGAGAGTQEAQAFTRAILAGRELGEPTSFGGQKPLTAKELETAGQRVAAGQQEFAAPIPVMRGMTTTYQGPRTGTEYASEGQAIQALRREQGAGEYVPPGGSLAGLQGKTAGIHHMIDERVKARNLESFTNQILGDEFGRFSQRDAQGKLVLNPAFEPLLLRLREQAMLDPAAAFQEFERQAPRLLEESRLLTNEGVAAAAKNYTAANKLTLADPNSFIKRLMTPRTDPNEERERRDFIVKWAQATPAPPPLRPTATPPPLRPTIAQTIGLEAPAFADFESGRPLAGIGEVGKAAFRGVFGTPEQWEKEFEKYHNLAPLRKPEEKDFNRRLSPLSPLR